VQIRVEPLPGFKFKDKIVKLMEITRKIGITGKR
jgi:hypothetical protein